jgi:hypothetical protein
MVIFHSYVKLPKGMSEIFPYDWGIFYREKLHLGIFSGF